MQVAVAHKNSIVVLGRPIGIDLIGPVAKTLGFALLIALCAQVRIEQPGNPIPVTLQTVGVLLCGFALRPRLAVAAVTCYLVGGFVGLPFFAAYRAGQFTQTLGYLVGFLAAAGLVSMAARSFVKLTLWRSVGVALLGTCVIFAAGVTWLAVLTGSVERALLFGFYPFVPWAAVKVAVAASLVQVVRTISWDRPSAPGTGN